MTPPELQESKRAALLDGSFYAARYHIVAENGEGSACDPKGSLLTVRVGGIDVTIPAEEAPEGTRCRRSACERQWPK